MNAALAGEPQLVTRRGRPAVVVLAADEYERLRRLDRADAPALDELLTQIPQDVPGLRAHFRPCPAFHWLVLLKERGRPPLRSNQPVSSVSRWRRIHQVCGDMSESTSRIPRCPRRRSCRGVSASNSLFISAMRRRRSGVKSLVQLGKRMSSAHYVSLSHLSSG